MERSGMRVGGCAMARQTRITPSAQSGLRIYPRIVQTEHAALLVVGEELAVARERDHGAQRLLGPVFRHVILELVAEAARRRAVAGALVEKTGDVGGEREGREHG